MKLLKFSAQVEAERRAPALRDPAKLRRAELELCAPPGTADAVPLPSL